MHFFNPALVMKCVEVVRHEHTSQATVETTLELARRSGKQPVLINREIPGFIANRLMGALQRGGAGPGGRGHRQQGGHRHHGAHRAGASDGPFELMDMVGLDVNSTSSPRPPTRKPGTPRTGPTRSCRKCMKQGGSDARAGTAGTTTKPLDDKKKWPLPSGRP